MPKVVCGCGAAFPLSEAEARQYAGKALVCPKCAEGKRHRAQLPATRQPSKPIGEIPQVGGSALPPPFPKAFARKRTAWNLSRIVVLVVLILAGITVGWAAFARKGNSEFDVPRREVAAAKPMNVPLPNPKENTRDAVQPAKPQADMDAGPKRIELVPDQRAKKDVEPAIPKVAECQRNMPAEPVGEEKIKMAVRAELRENLNDADFDEVRWWPITPLANSYQYNNPWASDLNLRLSEGHWKKITRAGQSIRLKFRTRNGLGAKVLSDWMFLFNENGNSLGGIVSTDFRLPNEDLDDYTRRMQSSEPTASVIRGAIRQQDLGNAGNNALSDLTKMGQNGQGNARGPLDNDPANANPKNGKQKAKSKQKKK